MSQMNESEFQNQANSEKEEDSYFTSSKRLNEDGSRPHGLHTTT